MNLSVQEAEQHSMSIRLMSGGLLFSLRPCNADVVSIASSETSYIEFSSNKSSYSESVRESLFSNEFLLLPYRDAIVYYEPLSGILIPNDLYSSRRDDVSDWIECLLSTDLSSTHHTAIAEEETNLLYSCSDEDKLFVCRFNKDLHNLLGRSLYAPKFVPYFALTLAQQKQLARHSEARRLCIFLKDNGFDTFLLEESGQSFYNSFRFVRKGSIPSNREELLYYISSLWKMFVLDSSNDVLCLIDATTASIRDLGQDTLSNLVDLNHRIKNVEISNLSLEE